MMLPCVMVSGRVPGRTGACVPVCSLGNALSSVQAGVEATNCIDVYVHIAHKRAHKQTRTRKKTETALLFSSQQLTPNGYFIQYRSKYTCTDRFGSWYPSTQTHRCRCTQLFPGFGTVLRSDRGCCYKLCSELFRQGRNVMISGHTCWLSFCYFYLPSTPIFVLNPPAEPPRGDNDLRRPDWSILDIERPVNCR